MHFMSACDGPRELRADVLSFDRGVVPFVKRPVLYYPADDSHEWN